MPLPPISMQEDRMLYSRSRYAVSSFGACPGAGSQPSCCRSLCTCAYTALGLYAAQLLLCCDGSHSDLSALIAAFAFRRHLPLGHRAAKPIGNRQVGSPCGTWRVSFDAAARRSLRGPKMACPKREAAGYRERRLLFREPQKDTEAKWTLFTLEVWGK
jgi:hypothetical protein